MTIDCGVTAFAGIWATSSDRLAIKNVTVHDCVYAGVMVLSSANGSVTNSRISNIGVVGYEAHGMNAYGIAFSDTGGPPTSGFAVTGNIIDNVPQWHGIDTHAGRFLTINDNIIHRCNRAIFLTSSSTNGSCQDISANRNTMDTPTPRVDVMNTYPYNEVGLTVVSGSLRVTGDGNNFDGWPTGNHLDTQGGPNGFTNNHVTNPK